jgi:periplasmic protein TonB
MFDLISGGPRHPFHDPTPAPVVASIAGHAVVLTLVVVLPLMYVTDRLPKVPVMMAFVAAPPVPPPPPPPRTTARSAGKPATPRPQSAPASGTFAVPLEAPSAIVPEPPAAMYSGEGGVEGGIEGGVGGGIVGGLVAAPLPPPLPPVAPPALKPAEPIRIGGKIAAPGLVKRVEPVYPDVALMAKIGGMVILEAVVDTDGSVESVRVLRSVKFLDGAAIDAVKQWKYSPLILNGVPTPFVLTVTLNFHSV